MRLGQGGSCLGRNRAILLLKAFLAHKTVICRQNRKQQHRRRKMARSRRQKSLCRAWFLRPLTSARFLLTAICRSPFKKNLQHSSSQQRFRITPALHCRRLSLLCRTTRRISRFLLISQSGKVRRCRHSRLFSRRTQPNRCRAAKYENIWILLICSFFSGRCDRRLAFLRRGEGRAAFISSFQRQLKEIVGNTAFKRLFKAGCCVVRRSAPRPAAHLRPLAA